MNVLELLRATELFSKLSDDELDQVAKCEDERTAAAGEMLIREGQPGTSLYIVRSGRVAVEKGVGDDRARLAELGSGAIFGEMSLIDNFPTSAAVTTLEASSFLVISRLDLNVLLNWNTVLAAKMWRSFTEMLCYRLRNMNEKLVRLGHEGTQELIASTADI